MNSLFKAFRCKNVQANQKHELVWDEPSCKKALSAPILEEAQRIFKQCISTRNWQKESGCSDRASEYLRKKIIEMNSFQLSIARLRIKDFEKIGFTLVELETISENIRGQFSAEEVYGIGGLIGFYGVLEAWKKALKDLEVIEKLLKNSGRSHLLSRPTSILYPEIQT